VVTSRRPITAQLCPCGTGNSVADCCGKYLEGGASAPTAETLMRSRYTAFALMDTDYLKLTWHPDHRPATLDLDPHQRWTGLEILSTERGSLFDSDGTVEFRAHYSYGTQRGNLHERSRFARIDGRWLYVDGDIG
jgi:SEC-C motif-containing protein